MPTTQTKDKNLGAMHVASGSIAAQHSKEVLIAVRDGAGLTALLGRDAVSSPSRKAQATWKKWETT